MHINGISELELSRLDSGFYTRDDGESAVADDDGASMHSRTVTVTSRRGRRFILEKMLSEVEKGRFVLTTSQTTMDN